MTPRGAASLGVASSGVVLARNESGRRFPHSEDAEALRELRSEVVDLLEGGQWDRPWRVYDLEALSYVEVDHLVEQGLMTPMFADGAGEGRGFAVYGEGQASLEINGLDHLRIVGFREGSRLDAIWALLNQLDDKLETVFSYAFDARWGYLSAQPRQAGSGMRAFATLVLPALMLTGRLAGTAVELATQGLGIAPLWDGAGGVVQVSNLGHEGKTESETLQQISEICSDIIERERSVRKVLLREHPIQSRDQIGRALGTAQQAWSVSFLEAVNLVSAIQVGVDTGLVESPGLATEPAFGLMSRLQSAHIVVDYMDGRTGCLESPEIDQRRAQVLRDLFASTGVRR